MAHRDLIAVRRVLLLAFLIAGFAGYACSQNTITEYNVPTTDAGVAQIALGPDNAMWFVESFASLSVPNRGIARITTAGAITEFTLPAGVTVGGAITKGPDGQIWFAEYAGITPPAKIASITTTGVVKEFPYPGDDAVGVVTGPDGALWFTETASNHIGRLTTAGGYTVYTVPTAKSNPTQIAVGSDNALWFTEEVGNKIGRITTSGAFMEFALPAQTFPTGITAGPDGALWFTGSGVIGRITTGGVVTTFPVQAQSPDIATGQDGALWFSAGRVGRITTSGSVTYYTIPGATYGADASVAAGPDGAMWFTQSEDNRIGRVPLTIANASAPNITQIMPNPISAGSPATTLRILGAALQGSCANTSVTWNSTALAVISVTGTEVDATVPANLLSGPTTATVTVTVPYASGLSCPTQSAQASVQVVNQSPAGGSLGISPGSLSFSASPGNLPAAKVIGVTSTGSSLSFGIVTQLTSSAPANWISASPTNATTPANVTVSVLQVALSFPAGTYTANVNFSATNGSTQTAAITLQVNAGAANDITVTQALMVFGALVNAPAPPSQSLSVGTVAGPIQFSTQVSYQSTPPVSWLQVPAGNSAPTTLSIFISPAGLPPGQYTGYLNLTALGHTNSYQVVVALLVEGSPDDRIAFSYQIGGPEPAPKPYQLVSNNGSPLTLTVGANSDVGWLSLTANSTTTPVNLSISASAGPGVSPGTYFGIVVSTDLQGDVYVILATLSVTGGGNSAGGGYFVPITPCRLVDTRNPIGSFGGPAIAGGSMRSFPIPSASCGIPSGAAAYSLNIAVVPHGPLGYLTIWPTGQPQPVVSTLNSLDGRVKSNAAIVPAGSGGAASVFVTDTTDVVIDTNGYFVAGSGSGALELFPLAPCRVADTRNPTGLLGGPNLSAASVRSFPILSSPCNVPTSAQAFSLNFTAVPTGVLGYLTVWPSNQPQPGASSLNDPAGINTANAVIVPSGASGAVSVFSTDNTDLVVDINGYFGPPGSGGLALYTLQPCRVLDTRQSPGALISSLTVNVTASSCGVPANAKAFVLNATVVPNGFMGFLTLWPQGQAQPQVSTLNATDGAITSNMAIVPTTNGSINVYASQYTHLILDISGYFAP